jgi:cytochrome c5
MANQSGAKFKEPAPAKPQAPQSQQQVAAAPPAVPPAPAPAQQQQQKPAAADGKAVFDKVCMACHASGVAGAPKVGDKAAWAPRIQTGMDSLLQAALKGKGAMPPKGGDQSLSDAQVRAAIEFMVSQSK